MLDLTSGELDGFASSEQSLTSPTFSPSGNHVAYTTDFEGDEDHDIVIADAKSRRTHKLTDGVADNFEPNYSPHGNSIAFLSNRDADIENIFIVRSAGGRIRKLTNEELSIKHLCWSPEGRRIVYQTGVGDEDTISIVNVENGKTKRILAKKKTEFQLAHDYGAPSPWSPDGKSILFLSNENDPYDIGMLDLTSMKPRWLVRSENEKYQPQWSPNGGALAYLEVHDPNILVKVKRGGTTKIVSPKDGVSNRVRWLPDGSGLVFLNGSAVRPQEVFLVTGSASRRLTRLQKKPLERSLIYPKLVSFESFDGRRIPSLLFVPKDRSRRAGIVMPHGGPEAQTLNEWDQLPQMLTDKGFVVIQPNYRGSTGYGHEFLHLHDRDHGGGDVTDTVCAGKYLIDSGLIDKDRLGYWGASYSGFTCMLALTKWPDMWAAGVSIVGFFNWETEIANERGYLKAYDRKKMGDPTKNPEFFRNKSPIFFLENLRVPLLMTASTRDVRCPPTESRAVVRKLKELHMKVSYHEYKDEGHWPRKRKNLRDLYLRSTRFLDSHILK